MLLKRDCVYILRHLFPQVIPSHIFPDSVREPLIVFHPYFNRLIAVICLVGFVWSNSFCVSSNSWVCFNNPYWFLKKSIVLEEEFNPVLTFLLCISCDCSLSSVTWSICLFLARFSSIFANSELKLLARLCWTSLICLGFNNTTSSIGDRLLGHPLHQILLTDFGLDSVESFSAIELIPPWWLVWVSGSLFY